MDNLEVTMTVETENIEQPETEFTQNEETVVEPIDNTEDTSAVSADYVKKDDEEDEDESTNDEDPSSSEQKDSSNEDEDDEENKRTRKYELLEKELNELKEAYSLLQNQCQELTNFKKEIDNQKKDELIAEFYMLSDEDKAEVISNKEKYTLDEIKAKLSVVCFDKKINFTLNEKEDHRDKEENIITYSLNENEDSGLPDWVKAVKEQEKLG